MADIQADRLKTLARELKSESHIVDVSDYQQVKDLIEACFQKHGRLDYLFNNAGIAAVGDARDLDIGIWRKVVDINLMGVIYGCQIAYPLMVQQGSGHIVNTASLAGLVGMPGMIPYATTKFAAVGLSRTLRIEASHLGIQVSVICPGFIESNIYEASECANIDNQQVRKLIRLPILDTAIASRKILKGVLAQKELIVFPAYAHLMFWFYKWFSGLITLLRKDMLNNMRKFRLKQ